MQKWYLCAVCVSTSCLHNCQCELPRRHKSDDGVSVATPPHPAAGLLLGLFCHRYYSLLQNCQIDELLKFTRGCSTESGEELSIIWNSISVWVVQLNREIYNRCVSMKWTWFWLTWMFTVFLCDSLQRFKCRMETGWGKDSNNLLHW